MTGVGCEGCGPWLAGTSTAGGGLGSRSSDWCPPELATQGPTREKGALHQLGVRPYCIEELEDRTPPRDVVELTVEPVRAKRGNTTSRRGFRNQSGTEQLEEDSTRGIHLRLCPPSL